MGLIAFQVRMVGLMPLRRHVTSCHPDLAAAGEESLFGSVQCDRCHKVLLSGQIEKHKTTYHEAATCEQCGVVVEGTKLLK